MERFVERGLLTTFGALLFLQERAGEVIGDMMERGRLAPEEGRRLLEDLSDRLEKDVRETEERVQDVFDASLKEAGLATERDIKDMRARLARIETRLDEIAASFKH